MLTLVLQNKFPSGCLFRRTLYYNFLRAFGCFCFLFLRLYHTHKLDFRSSPYVFLGYSSSHLCYRCLDLTFQCIYVSSHICFHEDVYPFMNSEQITYTPNTLQTTYTPPTLESSLNLLAYYFTTLPN